VVRDYFPVIPTIGIAEGDAGAQLVPDVEIVPFLDDMARAPSNPLRSCSVISKNGALAGLQACCGPLQWEEFALWKA